MAEERQDDTRRREDAALRTEEHFKLFLEQYNRDQERDAREKETEIAETLAWRLKFEERVKPLEDLQRQLATPARVICGVIILMATPALGVLGWDCGKWFIIHLQAAINSGKP